MHGKCSFKMMGDQYLVVGDKHMHSRTRYSFKMTGPMPSTVGNQLYSYILSTRGYIRALVCVGRASVSEAGARGAAFSLTPPSGESLFDGDCCLYR